MPPGGRHVAGAPGRWLAAACLACWLAAAPASGQLYHFGRNKVQFSEFAWQRLATAHFDLYFFAEEQELARYAACMAETAFVRLQRDTGHTVSRRIPLIVYSSHLYFEQTNVIPDLLPEGVGGFTEFLKGRVALPLSGSVPEFARVLRHELVHVFVFDRIRQVQRRLRVLDFRSPPLWFSEGLAEHWSADTAATGGMVLRDALFGDRLVPLSQLELIEGTFLLYKEGEDICGYLARRYGDDVFGLLLDNWWRAEDFGGVFAAVTGDSLPGLDRDWQYDLRKRLLPEFGHRDLPSQLARPVTSGGFNLRPAWAGGSPDSGAFFFFRNQRGYTQIARASLQGGPATVVVEGERTAAYESLHPLSTRLAVSADGRQLAFVAQHRGCDRLFVWDLARRRLGRELALPGLVTLASPAWSPDGSEIAVVGNGPDGLADLYRVDLASGAVRPLTHDLYDDRDPAWSPDGRWLAFSSDRWPGGQRGPHHLFLLSLADNRVYEVTTNSGDDAAPCWSADGTQLVYASELEGVSDLWAVRLSLPQGGVPAREPQRRLTRVLTGAFDPVWAASQDAVLFTGYEDAAFQVFCLPVSTDSLADQAVATPLPSVVGQAWTLPSLADSTVTQAAYQRRLSLDIVQSQISQDPEFGTSGGVEAALSDVLGDDQYYLVLAHHSGAETGFADGLNMALARVHQGRRVTTSWGVFRLQDRLSGTYGRLVREQRLGGYAEWVYPFSVHDRVEARFSLRHARIDRQYEGHRFAGLLAANFVSYTHDHTLWMPTGPLEGERYSLGLGQTIDLTRSRRLNVSLYGDWRHYARLSRRTALASRVLGWRSQGDVPEYFSMGGSWTLRGYPWRSLWGSRLVLVNQELRFPLLDRLVIGFPFGSIDFSALRGAVFADAGNAWTRSLGDWQGSLGAGARLALGGVFVFRLDAARRTDFRSLDNDTRWEFFFGWDY